MKSSCSRGSRSSRGRNTVDKYMLYRRVQVLGAGGRITGERVPGVWLPLPSVSTTLKKQALKEARQ